MTAPVTTPDKLIELALRVEQASEGSREIDEAIFCELDLAPLEEGAYSAYKAPAYTSSLDSAMQLVPEGCAWTISSADPLTKAQAYACIADKEDNSAWVAEPWLHERTVWESYAATPPLALTAACLRALSHQGGQNG